MAHYEFIDAEYATTPAGARRAGTAPTIMLMCRWLGVSKSGFYEWRTRPTSATAARRELLKTKIAALFDAHHGVYGYRRMRELGLVAWQPRPWRKTTIPGQQPAAAADLVGRDFTATEPGTKLVGDI